MGAFWTIARHFDTAVGPGLMLLYPLYASIRAVESPSKIDDEQWLTYWILYSFTALTEMAISPIRIFPWIQPVWKPLKLGFIAWLVLPQFRGASFIYERLVRKQLIRCRTHLNKGKNKENGEDDWLEGMDDASKESLQRFISENGAGALDSIFEAARNELQKRIRNQALSKESQERS